MTTRENLSSRRGLGGFAALIGAALMIVSVFVPWFQGAGSRLRVGGFGVAGPGGTACKLQLLT